jgi:hypothetical protein
MGVDNPGGRSMKDTDTAVTRGQDEDLDLWIQAHSTQVRPSAEKNLREERLRPY